jgi:hypothetical protein
MAPCNISQPLAARCSPLRAPAALTVTAPARSPTAPADSRGLLRPPVAHHGPLRNPRNPNGPLRFSQGRCTCLTATLCCTACFSTMAKRFTTPTRGSSRTGSIVIDHAHCHPTSRLDLTMTSRVSSQRIGETCGVIKFIQRAANLILQSAGPSCGACLGRKLLFHQTNRSPLALHHSPIPS